MLFYWFVRQEACVIVYWLARQEARVIVYWHVRLDARIIVYWRVKHDARVIVYAWCDVASSLIRLYNSCTISRQLITCSF